MNQKLKLCFIDRIGIVADISSRIAQNGLSITSMEVIRRNDEAHVYLELENIQSEIKKDDLLEMFRGIKGLFEKQAIDFLPQQERENRFSVVLDNMSDGVISIDRGGNVTIINRRAREALCLEGKDVIGQPIDSLSLPQNPILDCLTERSNKAIKQDLTTPKGRLQYISTCKLIRDKHNQIIGAVEIAKDVREIKKLASYLSTPKNISFTDIIGKHDAIKQAINYAKKISDSDAVVSIVGESGTGKELFARAIHTHSRRPGPFIPVNCAALPEQLLESELFGYMAGAYTGGKRGGSAGLFEEAKDGTIFLDEIAELPLSAQAKILRLIQERAVRRIGGSSEIHINARLITATNKSLEKLVQEKRFRQDLYYRISVLPIHIPSLRERIEDIPLLVDHFLFQMANKLDQNANTITRQALLMLRDHDWPGNIRELKNVIDRAAILCENDTIDIGSIILGAELIKPKQRIQQMPSSHLTLKQHVSSLEKEIIQKALQTTPSLRQAAKSLSISHSGLIKKMRKLDMHFSKVGKPQ